MKRKEFIAKSSMFVAGGIIAPQLVSCLSEKKKNLPQIDLEILKATSQSPRTNWAKNYIFHAENLYEPTSVEQVQELVKTLGKQKALGSKHCFNAIADSPKSQISTRKLNKVVEIDRDNKTITVEAGARYGDFSEELHKQGYALHNLASLPHITVAGACATATHGSGVKNGNLATGVRAVELVTPTGDLVKLDRLHADFNAVVVGLGAFGILTKLTLDIQPTYDVRQDVFMDLPLESALNNFDEIMSSGYSVSLFTDWMDDKVSEVWIKRRMDEEVEDLGTDFYGAAAAVKNMHPIAELSAESCSEQMGVPGPWYNRLAHFKMGFQPSAGKELQSEYFVPREHAVDALRAMLKLKDEIKPLLMISEIRTIAADDFWMSPCYKQDCITIHSTWKQETEAVIALLPKIEEALAPFNVKPHLGKLFTIPSEVLHERYDKFNDFLALREKYDPEGKFVNNFLTKNIL